MGLEAPLALLGLLAALLPLLAHRTRQRDLKLLPFPTLQLLQRAEVRKRSRSHWTDRMLLLLRMALLALACLAVAAPFVNARMAFGDGRVSSAAIVIDDSMSMLRQDGSKRVVEAAHARARAVIESLPEGSEISLIAAGKPARVIVPLTDDRSAALSWLARDPSGALRANDMDGALALAGQQLGAARHDSRRLLVLSDFAAHAQPSESALALDAVAMQFERIGAPPQTGNLFIESVDVSVDPTLPGQLSLAIEVGSHGPAVERVSLRVRSGGADLAPLDVSMSEGHGRALTHIPVSADGEDPTALIEIMTVDALQADNRVGILRQPVGGPRILLINGDPRPATADDELYYLQQALAHAPAGGLSAGARQIDASALDHHELDGYDAVVMANVETPSARWIQRARSFIDAGGALLIAPGSNFDLKRAKERYGDLLAAPIRGVGGGAAVGLLPGKTAALLPEGPSGLTQVQTSKRLLIEADAGSLLAFSDGTSALSLGARGRGQVALLAVPLDDDWSDLPVRPGYMALVNTLLKRLCPRAASDGPTESGAPHRIEVPPRTRALEVVDPDAERIHVDDPTGSYAYEGALGAGPYRVLIRPEGAPLKDAPRKAFFVRAPIDDSDLTPGPVPDTTDAGTRTGASAPRVQLRRSLSPIFFSLAGLLVLCEALLRSRPFATRARERAG